MSAARGRLGTMKMATRSNLNQKMMFKTTKSSSKTLKETVSTQKSTSLKTTQQENFRGTRKSATNLSTSTLVLKNTLTSSRQKETCLKSSSSDIQHNSSHRKAVMEKPAQGDKRAMESSETADSTPVKKLKIDLETTSISPRRSLRAIVPNRRYQDIEDTNVDKKNSEMKFRKSTPTKQANVSVAVHEQVDEDVTEEIITDETHVDMNLMDDMLILPPSQSTIAEMSLDGVDTDKESTENEAKNLYKIANMADKVNRPVVKTNFIKPKYFSKETDNTKDKCQTQVSQACEANECATPVPSPQVIIIPSEPTLQKERFSANKERLSIDKCRYVKSDGKVKIQVVSAKNDGKGTRTIMVTHTKGQNVINQENAITSEPRKFETKDGVIQNLTNNLVTATSSSVTSGIFKGIVIKSGGIIHTPEKKVQPLKQIEQEISQTKSTIEVQQELIQSNVDLMCNEDLLELDVTRGANPSQIRSSSDVGVDNVKPAHSVNEVKRGPARIVYVRALARPASQTTVVVSQSGSESLPAYLNIEQNISRAVQGENEKAENFTTQTIENIVNSTSEILDRNNIKDVANEVITPFESMIAETNALSVPESEINNMHVDGVDKDKNMDIEKTEQHLSNSLCQDLEAESSKETSLPVIEYVMFNDKIIPIHKSYLGPHGHVHSTRLYAGRKAPGRIDVLSLKKPNLVKKIPLAAAQITIGSGLPNGILPELHSDNLQEQDKEMMIESLSEGISTDTAEVKLEPRVVHGFIDHPVPTTVATQIVEISQDMFAKEVYGDSFPGESVDELPGSILDIKEITTFTRGNLCVDSMAAENMILAATSQSMNSDMVGCSAPLPSTQAHIFKTSASVSVSEDNLDMSSWTVNTPMVCTEIASLEPLTTTSVPAMEDNSNVFHIGVDSDQIPQNASYMVTKMSNGEEATVVHIKPLAERAHPFVQKISVAREKNLQFSGVNQPMPPIIKRLTDVKITPVRAYNKGEYVQHIGSTASNDNNGAEKPRPTGTSIETQTELDSETDDTDDEQEANIDQVPETHGLVIMYPPGQDLDNIKYTPTNIKEHQDQVQYKEYIVVQVPEGKEVKQVQTRQIVRDPVHEEAVTVSEDGMYTCVDCDHKTDKKANWLKHRRKHLGIRPHGCPQCPYKAASSSNLKRHMQIHLDIRNFHCTICGLLFRQKIHLERHLKYKHEEKKIKCPLCDYLCSSENPDLKIHIRRRHMPQEDGSMAAFTCNDCGLMTVSKKDLKQHLKFHKKGPELKLFCEYCSFVTDCVSRLRRHMLIHTKERPYQCGLCSYRATQKEHVLRHMRSQHNVEVEHRQRRSLLDRPTENRAERSSVAGSTQSVFTVRDTSSDSDTSRHQFEKSDYSSTDKIFACNHCSMKFSKLINLYKHLYAQHTQVMPDPGDNDFQCVVCDFRTNNKKNLLVHMRKHNMQDHSPPTHVYSCVLCQYINPRRRNLFQHMKKKHGIEIIMKEDGLNCYVTMDGNIAEGHSQDEMETNVMALSDIVTTQAVDDISPQSMDDSQLHVIDDGAEFHAGKIPMDNIISVEDMTSYVSSIPQEHNFTSAEVVVGNSMHIPTHEAAEAIEGLQALAQQVGILETQNIDNDMTSEIMTEGEIITIGEETLIEQQSGETTEDIQLSSEQLSGLSSGDFVEINGEVYKVEIAQEQLVTRIDQ